MTQSTRASAPTSTNTHPRRKPPRCIVVQEPMRMEQGKLVPRINLSHLLPYGKIEFLFNWSDVDTPLWNNLPAVVERLYRQLEDFSDDDYLVPLGNPALIGMAMMIAGDVNEGRVRVLDWKREDRAYREVQIDLDAESD